MFTGFFLPLQNIDNRKNSFKIKTSNLSKAHETRNSLSSSYSQIVLIYLYPFRLNSLFKTAPQPHIAKNTKTPILEVQGKSRSSTLTPIKSLSPVLVMISSMSLPICNRFHATRANRSKITTLTLACAGLLEPRESGRTWTAEIYV